MFNKINSLLLIFFLTLFLKIIAFESYTIDFEGVTSDETLNVIKSVCQLIALEDIPPVSDSSLKRRAEADIPNIIKALHSLSFYNGKVDLQLDFNQNPVRILFTIDEGDPYPFGNFSLVLSESCQDNPLLDTITPSMLGIILKSNALPKDILNAEELLLLLLERAGYPLGFIEKREVIIDQQKKQVLVTLTVSPGPLCPFGHLTISGNHSVSSTFIKKKLAWKEGKIYDPSKLEETQNALEQTGLFSTISIEKGELHEDGTIPVNIYLQEAKQRSIGVGLGYATVRGVGVANDWEHRNIRNMGEKLSLKTNLWKDTQEAALYYLIPDFAARGADLRLMLDYEHERTKGYSEVFYSTAALIERQINDQIRISYGGMYKQLHDSRSDNNRDFNLIKSPFHFRFNNTNNLLDPTSGYSFNLKSIPSFQLLKHQFFYSINTLITSIYFPLTKDQKLILADKITFGTILGATNRTIPPSERFYAGSDNLLRGYNYLTVSPLNSHDKPIGGRSMLINSLELRYRTSESLGLCLFYEAGNVYKSYLPAKEKILQSGGFGIRYYTPVGPLRADLAFPFNRRKHVDAPFQFYISIGQAF